MLDTFLYNFNYLFNSTNSVIAFVFVLGSLIGSFLNVCAYRLPIGRSIVSPGSACVSCGQPVKYFLNVPILGYFFLRGRCAECASPFSFRYALIEFIVACLTVFLFVYNGGFTLDFFYWLFFTAVLVVVFLIDLDHWLILDCVTVPAIIVGLIGYSFLGSADYHDSFLFFFFPELTFYTNGLLFNFFDSVLGIAFGYIFFSFISFWGTVILRQEAMGGGDIKFAMVIGAFLGLEQSLIAFMMSFFVGFLFVVPFLLFLKKSGREPLPFGTFMAIAAFVTLFWGRDISGHLMGF